MRNRFAIQGQLKNRVLLVLSVIVAMSTGTFAASAKKSDSAINQVKSDLRSIAEASVLWEKTGNCTKHECADVDKLMSAGTLTVEPNVPSGLGDGDPAPLYNATERRVGGCGSLTPGAPRHVHPALYYVSEKFCRMYNESVGLGNSIIENCGSGGDCAASGSADLYDFPVINSPSFCYRRNDRFAIVWISTVAGAPCPQQ